MENTVYLKLIIIGGFNFQSTPDIFRLTSLDAILYAKLPIRILHMNASCMNIQKTKLIIFRSKFNFFCPQNSSSLGLTPLSTQFPHAIRSFQFCVFNISKIFETIFFCHLPHF